MAAGVTGEELTIDDYAFGSYTTGDYILGAFKVTFKNMKKTEARKAETFLINFYDCVDCGVPREWSGMFNLKKIALIAHKKKFIKSCKLPQKWFFKHVLIQTGIASHFELQTFYCVKKSFSLASKMFSRSVMRKMPVSRIPFLELKAKELFTRLIGCDTIITVLTPMNVPASWYIGYEQHEVIRAVRCAMDRINTKSMDEQLEYFAQDLELPVPDMNECMFEDALGELITAYAKKEMEKARANVCAVYAGTATLVIENGEPKVQMIAEPAAKRAQPN